MTTVDWIALAVVLSSALIGLRNGLIGSAFSLTGLVAGAYAGSRIAPHVLNGGASSPWTPMAGLAGALAGASLLQALGALGGSFARAGLKLTPLRLLDSGGGFVLGTAMGLALVWVLGAAALLVPGQGGLRRDVQRSTILRHLNDAMPPRRLLHLLARIDPFPSIVGPSMPTPPTPAIARHPGVRGAEASIVRILGTACGVGVEGSGWFARPRLVVTAAHVVAGQRDTSVQMPLDGALRRAVVVAFDPRNDVAVLRVYGAAARPLPFADPEPGTPVAILGFPDNGPLTATPGRLGRTAVVVAQNAYGRGPVARTITAVAGSVRHGNSGGPAVDAQGSVRATIFAARLGSPGGYGVPSAIVRRDVNAAAGRVSSGSCAA